MSAARALQEAVFAALVGGRGARGVAWRRKGVRRRAAKCRGALRASRRDRRARLVDGDGGGGGDFVSRSSRGRGRRGGRRGFRSPSGCVALLHDAALTLDGFRLVNLRHVATETARVEKPEGRRTVARFRAVVEPD